MQFRERRGRAAVIVLMLAATAGLSILAAARAPAEGSQDRDRINQGFRISPVAMNLRGKDRELVGLGSYLVNAVGGCNDCHTNPSYDPNNDPYQGQPGAVNAANFLAGGKSFGPFVSRNLTPDNGKPAGMTFAQFRTVIRTGIDMDNAHPQISPLLQVMPWPVYRHMTDHDLRAIYEYLRSIPPAQPGGTPRPAGD